MGEGVTGMVIDNILRMPEHDCPVHGKVTEVLSIQFSEDVNERVYCIRCIEQLLISELPNLNKSPNNVFGM
jgi:hypothetical protein